MSLAEDKENLGFRAKPMPGFQWTDVFDKLGLTRELTQKLDERGAPRSNSLFQYSGTH